MQNILFTLTEVVSMAQDFTSMDLPKASLRGFFGYYQYLENMICSFSASCLPTGYG
jgi:hypothetical protein